MDTYKFYYEQTPKTPLVDLNAVTGEFVFSGKSIPENASKIYEPVYDWINGYILNAKQTTNLRINFDYFNTTSSLWLAKIFKALTSIRQPEYSLIVHLYVPVEEFDEVEDFDDIKDAFSPISYAINSIPSISIRLYGTDDRGSVIKEAILFV